MRLGDKNIRMMDTASFDDSIGTDTPEKTLTRFLGETGKADLYPAFVILQSLSALEADLLQQLGAVFPEIVVAFRSENTTRLNQARLDIERVCTKKPIRIFHLQAFVSEEFDSGGSRQRYDDTVLDILRFYYTLTPSPMELDFSSPTVAGEHQEMPRLTESETQMTADSHVPTNREAGTVNFSVTEANNAAIELCESVDGSILLRAAGPTASTPPIVRIPVLRFDGYVPGMEGMDSRSGMAMIDLVYNGQRMYNNEIRDAWEILGAE